jgi:outer membrane protein, heavy metal efflux system
MPVRFAFVAVLLLLFAVPNLHAETTRPPESLSSLIAIATANNPELKAAASRWEGSMSRIRQAGSWDDPMLMLKIQNGLVTDPLNFTKDQMTQKVIGVSQQIPYFGKRALRQEIAEREAESLHYNHQERRLELIRMVKEAYYQIYFTDRALAILDKNIGIIDTFVTLAETKYAVGQGAQQDIFKGQLDRSKMLDMKITLEQQRKSLVVALNALLYRPATTPVGAIPEFALGANPPDADRLLQIAEENRPALKGLNAQIRKAEGSYALAKKEYFPDFNVSFEYMQRDQVDDMYSLGVTFNLPVRREKRAAMVAEATSETRMAQEELNATRNTIASGIADLLAQMERRKRLVDLYRNGIIPQAQQSLESSTIGYRVNKVDFLTLLDSRITLFNYEKEYFDSMADYQMKKAQLEALIGKELE